MAHPSPEISPAISPKQPPEATPLLTLGDWAYRAIASHYHSAIAHEAGTIADQDPEELHQLRVGLRRLRSAVTGFAIALDWPNDASERLIGRFGRTFGGLRDLDVMGATLKGYRKGDLPKGERQRLDQALKHLRDRRRMAYRQTLKALGSKPYHRFKVAVQTWLETPQYAPSARYGADRAIPDLLLPETARFLIHPAWTIAPTDPATANRDSFGGLALDTWNCLHDLRKQAKRLRYQMALIDGFYGQTLAPHVKLIAEVQEVLGNLQDSAVLEDFLKAADLKLPKDLPTLHQWLQGDRADNWTRWQALRDHYADATTCQTLRQLIATSVTPPPPKEPAPEPAAKATKTTGATGRKTTPRRRTKPAPAPESLNTESPSPESPSQDN
ncbi:MAG: CHAD domain-containing protein [Cyanophyceae cyanobacterium]